MSNVGLLVCRKKGETPASLPYVVITLDGTNEGAAVCREKALKRAGEIEPNPLWYYCSLLEFMTLTTAMLSTLLGVAGVEIIPRVIENALLLLTRGVKIEREEGCGSCDESAACEAIKGCKGHG